MGISISNATSSAITKYSESLRSGEPDWSMIPSAGKSNKSQAEFGIDGHKSNRSLGPLWRVNRFRMTEE